MMRDSIVARRIDELAQIANLASTMGRDLTVSPLS
jgi:hypothetical protein